MPRPFLLLLASVLLGCSPSCSGRASEPSVGEGWVECVVPRPEMCTKEWRPVCGLRDTGIRCVTSPCDSWETKTFGNACVACADGGVYGWRPGECAEEGVVRDG